MSNKIALILVVLIVLAGGFLMFRNKTSAPVENSIDNNMPVAGENTDETIVNQNVKEFTVEGGPFYFKPSVINVNKGDMVKITFKNAKGTHDWSLDEFNVATRVLNAGEEQTVSFVADKSGDFEYYCSVGNHRAQGMVGKFMVR